MTNSQASLRDNHSPEFVRTTFLKSLVGAPYEKNAKGPDKFDCWHLAVYIQDRMFGRIAPHVEIPMSAGWSWMIEQFTTHPELGNWVERLQPPNGLVNALDGSIVLMARTMQPAHCGVWLEKERRVIHADEGVGVILEDLAQLKANAWYRLRFYEPR